MSSLLLSFYIFPIIALDRNNFKYNARETVILVSHYHFLVTCFISKETV